MLARRVGKSPVGLYAHLDRNDRPLRSLQPKSPGPMPRPLTRGMFSYRSDNDLAQFAALKCGVGIGGRQHGIARNHPELVPVLAKVIRFELDMWVVMHEDMRSTTRIKRLFDHLNTELSAFLRGR